MSHLIARRRIPIVVENPPAHARRLPMPRVPPRGEAVPAHIDARTCTAFGERATPAGKIEAGTSRAGLRSAPGGRRRRLEAQAVAAIR